MTPAGKKAPDTSPSNSRQHPRAEARRRPGRGWHRFRTPIAALALCLAGQGVAAQDHGTGCEGVACLARAVVDTIPDGETIALIPFRWPVTNLPKTEADLLYGDLNQAIYDASKKNQKLVRRDVVYDEIWEATKWEISESNYQSYVNRLRATVVVHCKDNGLSRDKLKFSCTAAGIAGTGALAGEMRPSTAKIPIERRMFPYEYKLTKLSNTLAAGVLDHGSGPQRIPRVFIVDNEIGQASHLTEDIGKRIQEGITRQFETYQHEQENRDSFSEAIGRQSDDAAKTSGGYELRGEFAWTDRKRELASLWVELREAGRPISQDRIELRRAWLPHAFTGTRRYDAEAQGIPSDSLHTEIASEAAVNLARARIVAQAVGVRAPAFEVVTTEAESMTALQILRHGVPVDEQIERWQDATGEQHVWLKARVVSVGGRTRPAVEAALTKSDLRSREKFGITLAAAATVHAGVFAWGADGRVVRLYPNAKVRDLIVPAGGRVSLPRSGDAYQDLWSAPLPGHSENHEAIIVVASIKPLDFASIGASVGSSTTETMSHAIPSGTFLDSLGELDLSQAALLILPYRVRL